MSFVYCSFHFDVKTGVVIHRRDYTLSSPGDLTTPPQYTCSQPLMIAMSTGACWLRQIAHVSSSGARSKAPAPASQPCKRTSVFRSNIGSIGISMIEIEHQRTRLRGPGVIALRRCHVRAKNNEYAELLDLSLKPN